MKALVLCGGLPQLELMKQLQARGIEAYLADMNPKAPAVPFADKFFLASAMDPIAVKKIAVDEGIDFILTVHADQALLIAAQVSEELGLPCYLDYENIHKLLKNAKKIAHIPAQIYENRWDPCCPPYQAFELHKALPKSKLHMVPSQGHISDKMFWQMYVDNLNDYKEVIKG